MTGRLLDVVADRRGEVLLFGVTPPRLATPPERVQEIADATMARLGSMDVDGLILYDIDDESDRNENERPFPYLPTIDPAVYAERFGRWPRPVVVYRCVGKYPEEALRQWLRRQHADRTLTVLVGGSSTTKPMKTTLPEAQRLWTEPGHDLFFGGVAIPERHSRGDDEHLRLLRKQRNGASFFVTQVVYDVSATKSMVSDYHHACVENGLAPATVVFTLSVCGSAKSLAFLQWLGVDVPRWLQNDLRYAADPLAVSLDADVLTAQELIAFCRRLGMPFGFNVESVSNRRVEIEASVELAHRISALLDRP